MDPSDQPTIFKQGPMPDSVVFDDMGSTEMSLGLTYVALPRV